jgi:hypothetical protein
MMETPKGARRYQIRLDRGDQKAGFAIPFNAVVEATFTTKRAGSLMGTIS